ncbi:MAG: glycosyltransferase family 4 protein [Patescibacteria group bacterium]
MSCIAPPEVGGIGRVASIEVEQLQARGIDAHLASLTTHTGFRVGNAGRIYALDHLVREQDVVHLHYPFFGTAELLPALKARGLFKRLVITLHMDATAAGWKGSIFSMYRSREQKKILESADVLIAASRDYTAHSSFAPYASRVKELPFGVDEARFSPGPSDRGRFGILSDVPLILFVGGMDKAHDFKGVKELLEALVGVPDAHLLLIGDGELRKGYEARAKELKIAARCHFVGKVDEDGLIAANRSADVLAFPSTSGAEAFGLVAVEAQACGIPVVASNLPGVRTVVQDGKTGMLVKPGDVTSLREALVGLLSDPVRRKEMGAAARERVLEHYTWTKHIDGLMEMYEKLNGGIPDLRRPPAGGSSGMTEL